MTVPTEISPAQAVHLVKNDDGTLIPFEQYAAEDALERDRMAAILTADEREALRDMRGSWSKWILRCIIWIVIFDSFIALNIGYGWMSFSGNALPIFVADSLIKIIGLAVVIVGFLFSKDSFLQKGKD